jgi:hypothetical protein
MNLTSHNTSVPDPGTHDRRQRHSSKFGQWLHRVRKSKREKRKLLNLIVLIATVLIAFAIGYYYFGPSFTYSENG